MKIMFWNTQRLGGGSTGKSTMITSVVSHAMYDLGVEVCLFCEVTSEIKLDDITLTKQLAVTKRNRRASSAQLGYGCISSSGSDSELVACEIPTYGEVFADPIGYRGGNAFSGQSKRKVAGCGKIGATPLFMYHANSSYKSTELVRWVVAALEEQNDEFLLVGDFNCSPEALHGALDWGQFHIASGGPTHNAKGDGGPKTTLDFAVGKGVVPTVEVLNKTSFFKDAGLLEMPDHLPIIVGVG